MSDLKNVALVILAIAIVVLAVWFELSRPCWTYSYTQTSGVPARCIGEFVHE